MFPQLPFLYNEKDHSRIQPLDKGLRPCRPGPSARRVRSVGSHYTAVVQQQHVVHTCCKLDGLIEYAVAREKAQRNTKPGEGSLVAVCYHRVLAPRILPSKHHRVSSYEECNRERVGPRGHAKGSHGYVSFVDNIVPWMLAASSIERLHSQLCGVCLPLAL